MRRTRSTTHAATHNPRPARRVYDEAPGKLPEIARCPTCKASYRAGRWTWESAPADAYAHVCPACERIASDYPAGVLHVGGDFARARRDDLIRLIRNTEERERARHPLKRIMSIESETAGLVVKVTDAKLALACGRALKRAYDGRLDAPASTADKENLVRVHWARD